MVSPTAYPPATPHDPIVEVFPDVFLVRGSYRANIWLRFNRNMVVLRQEGELTLINSVRLQPEAEAGLDELGDVRHVVRLAYFHGLDDRYYVDRYGATFWAPAGHRIRPGPETGRVLAAGGNSPINAGRVYVTRHARYPEAVMLLEREGGILLTGDSFQYYTDRRFCSPVARIMLPLMGFPLRMIIGPVWLRAMTPEGGSLQPDLQAIAALPFRHLIPGHGSLCRGIAKPAVHEAIKRVWPEEAP